MCGIFAIFSKFGTSISNKQYRCGKREQSLREIAYQQSGKQRHRGPDYTGVEIIEEHGVIMVHERLAIVGVQSGNQPMKSTDGTILLIANGEIYNYLEQAAEIAKKRGCYKPKSDCNVIIELYEEYGEHLLDYITGMFAFALYDSKTKTILMARDPIGIIPMYYGEDIDGNIWVSSEMKCLSNICVKINVFPPGKLIIGPAHNFQMKTYFQPLWLTKIPSEPTDLSMLKQKLESAVRTHLQCDVQLGALLSGGVDSSLIASIATKINKERNPEYKLKTYSVGLQGAPDFKYSRMVADFIGSDHKEIVFTTKSGLDCIRDIIYKLETYDVTTVRCSIPMYIMTRYIKSEGVKMILSGEGADELFGGYLYFFKAPNPEEFHRELVARVQNLHLSDCLRANKSSMSWGVELRVPFLDTEFVNYVMSLLPVEKIPGPLNTFTGDRISVLEKLSCKIEKHILRSAFADKYLPDEVIWRQKEQFSDGVGYSWIETIREYAASHISDEEFRNSAKTYPFNTPTTKEAFYYRTVFEELFSGEECAKTVKKWIPRTDWGCPEDPSGRAQTVHQARLL